MFVEEFTRLLSERGDAAGVSADSPATLQDLLLARLDRMESDKTVVQLGAVIGRTFAHAVIRAASELDESALQAELDKLVGAGLVSDGIHPTPEGYRIMAPIVEAEIRRVLGP